MNAELLRIIDAIHLEKDIDSELIFSTIENAMVAAIHRKVGEEVQIHCTLDRNTGELSVTSDTETGSITVTVGLLDEPIVISTPPLVVNNR